MLYTLSAGRLRFVQDRHRVEGCTDRSAKAFTTSDNITGMHVVFTPERSTDTAGNRVKQFLQGAKCEELPENRVEKDVQGGE